MTPGPALPRPRGVLFDLGDTLIHTIRFDAQAGARRLLAMAGRAGDPVEEEFTAFVAGWAERIRLDRVGSSYELPSAPLLRLAFARFGMEAPAPPEALDLEFWQAASRLEPLPGASEAVAGARDRGLPLGVFSNATVGAAVLEWELARHDLLEHLDVVMSSADHGLQKPEPDTLLAACARLGTAPEDTWYIGDTPANDVAGALAAGLTPIWCRVGAGAERDPGDAPAAAVLDAWDDLAALLDAAGA